MGLNDATRLKRVIKTAVEQETAAGARIDYRWGQVFEVGEDAELGAICSAYIEGNTEDISEDFQVLNGLHVEADDFAMFAFDARGHKWVEKLLPTDLHYKLRIDPVRGNIYTGDGLTPASTPFEPGVSEVELDAHESTGHLISHNTPNSLDTTNLWSLIAEGTITAQYGEVAAIALIGGNGSNGSTWTRGLLRFRIRQQDAFGGNPDVDLELVDGTDFAGANLKIIITSVDGPTVWKLYVQLTRTYEWLTWTPLWEGVHDGSLDWTPCVECVALGSLPAGTQYGGVDVGGGSLSYAAPGQHNSSNTPVEGTATTVARSDHNHGNFFKKQSDPNEGGEIYLEGAGTYPDVSIDTYQGKFRVHLPETSTLIMEVGDTKATPTTQAFGDVATAGTSDEVAFAGHKHGMPAAPTATLIGCKATRTATQAIADGTEVDILFTANPDEWDTHNFHDPTTNADRITIPAGQGGTYLVIANAMFDTNSTGQRKLAISVNGVQSSSGGWNAMAPPQLPCRMSVAEEMILAAGDIVRATVRQKSTVSLNINGASLSVRKIG